VLKATASVAQSDTDFMKNAKSSATISGRIRMNRVIADASHICSLLAYEKGLPTDSLSHAKRSVKLYYRAWASMENRASRQNSAIQRKDGDSEIDSLNEGMSKLSTSVGAPLVMSKTYSSLNGASFWPLVMPLYTSQSHLSFLYAHHGMFQEAIYYAEQACKVVSAVQAKSLLARNYILCGDHWTRKGNLAKGSDFFDKAKALRGFIEHTKDALPLHCSLGNYYRLQGNIEEEKDSYTKAEDILDALMEPSYIDGLDRIIQKESPGITQISKPTAKSSKAKGTSRPVKQATKKTKALVAKTSKPILHPSNSAECSTLQKMKGTVLRQHALSRLIENDIEKVGVLLQQAQNLPLTGHGLVEQRLAVARQLLAQGLQAMSADAVYCVLQDSTISLPAVAAPPRATNNNVATHDAIHPCSPSQSRSSPRKGSKVKAAGKAVRLSLNRGFVEVLREARESILEVHMLAIQICSTSTIHALSSVLGGITILQSAASTHRGRHVGHPSFATFSIEAAKTVAMERGMAAIASENPPTSQEELSWPAVSVCQAGKTRRVTQDCDTLEFAYFQRTFIDIIPLSWTAVSISLNEARDELYISRLKAGQSPFILRLPLGRHNSRDADEEVFDFEQGKAELLDVIDLANFSTHEARDMTQKGAKTEWWSEREALDTRMKDILVNIENIWLGGFRGIFSHSPRNPELLSRFGQSFQKCLDKHLPSRQKVKKRGKQPINSTKVDLDARILELFVGLGSSVHDEDDLEQPLTDLLYFVVDILQFHGERNAYDEIDFDSLVVETINALEQYNEAVLHDSKNETDQHTILILDKALHCIPWESLPCLSGSSVSRLPSLACLRTRILSQQQRPGDSQSLKPGVHVSKTDGAFILNPGGDLASTESAFLPTLNTLSTYTPIVSRAPTESEFRSCLSDKSVMLYFGHGSGAQYIRSRTIKSISQDISPSCAVALLMGCSSAHLEDAGEFEPHGPVGSYLQAGAPAVVGCLWDVTDKDLDRATQGVLQRWGLFERGSEVAEMVKSVSTEKKRKHRTEKGSARIMGAEERPGMGLDEAVARSRGNCILRYLNGAALVVYGVPVYLS
jgi:separase